MERHERGPRVLDRRAGGQLQAQLPGPGQLALDREQPDADPDRGPGVESASRPECRHEEAVADRQDGAR